MADRMSLMGQALTVKLTLYEAQQRMGLERLLAARKGLALIQQLESDALQAQAQGLRVARTRLQPIAITLQTLVRKGLVETAKLLSELLEGLPEHDQLRAAATQFLQILVSRHPREGTDIRIA